VALPLPKKWEPRPCKIRRDTATYWLKIANFPYISVVYRPRSGLRVTPLEFLETFYESWKLSLLRSWQWMFRDLSLRLFDRAAACDGQTHRHTDTHKRTPSHRAYGLYGQVTVETVGWPGAWPCRPYWPYELLVSKNFVRSGSPSPTQNFPFFNLWPCLVPRLTPAPQIRRVSRGQYCALYKFIYLFTYLLTYRIRADRIWPLVRSVRSVATAYKSRAWPWRLRIVFSIRRINICAMPRKKKQPRVPGFGGDRTHWPYGPDRRDRRLCVIQA